MARFLFFLLILFLARLLWNAVASMIAGRARQQMGGSGRPGDNTIHRGQMVRDPVCGLHLPESRAISVTRSGERFHFCSERCRQSFSKAS